MSSCKYEKNFDVVVAFLTQYVNKRAMTPSVKVTCVGQKDQPSGQRPTLPMALSKERLS